MGDEAKRESNVQQALTANPGTEPDLEQIYREHHRRVIQAAYRVTGNPQDAEDVLQTVFMRLVRREGGSPLSDSLGNYLHRAAINAALDIVRSKRSARASALEGVEPTLAAAAEEAPDKVQGGSELKEQIRIALARMSAKAALPNFARAMWTTRRLGPQPPQPLARWFWIGYPCRKGTQARRNRTAHRP